MAWIMLTQKYGSTPVNTDQLQYFEKINGLDNTFTRLVFNGGQTLKVMEEAEKVLLMIKAAEASEPGIIALKAVEVWAQESLNSLNLMGEG